MAQALTAQQRRALVTHIFLVNTRGTAFHGDSVLADLDRLLPGIEQEEVLAGCADYQAIAGNDEVREWMAEIILEASGGLS